MYDPVYCIIVKFIKRLFNGVYCKMTNLDDNRVYVKYDKVKSVTPGQTCVFYIDDLCIGGGTIDKIYKDQEELWYL